MRKFSWLVAALGLLAASTAFAQGYGFRVGCQMAGSLRGAGFDAKYMKGGHSAWKAIGGPTKKHV